MGYSRVVRTKTLHQGRGGARKGSILILGAPSESPWKSKTEGALIRSRWKGPDASPLVAKGGNV